MQLGQIDSEQSPLIDAIDSLGGYNSGSIQSGIPGITETDPIFVSSSAYGITGTNISGWNIAYTESHTHSNKSALDLVSGTNTGDQIIPTLSSLNAVAANSAITGGTYTKITYDSKGLVLYGSGAITSDIISVTNYRYVTDSQLATIQNISGTNTGDETATTIKTKLGIVTLSGSNTGDQTLSSLGGIAANTLIAPGTGIKITYDANGLVLYSSSATTADISDTTNKRYVTDAQLAAIGIGADTSLLVPYTGATGNLNLGVYTIATPKIIGGSTAPSTLILQSTTGTASTGAGIKFRVGNNGSTEVMTIFNNATIGINNISPSAQLHISAGMSSAGTSPIKLTSGPLMSTAEVGAIEFLNDAFYATITTGSVRKQIAFTSDIPVLSGVLTTTGSSIGATSQAQQFSFGIKTGILYPSSDTTTAIQFMKSNGITPVVTIDTANSILITSGDITISSGHNLNIGSNKIISTYSWGGANSNLWLGGASNSTVIEDGTNIHSGNWNIAILPYSLSATTTGNNNFAAGAFALTSNTTGWANAAIGPSTLYRNTTGNNNISIGNNALFSNTTGNFLIALGSSAGVSDSFGSYNATSSSSLYLGDFTSPYTTGDTNEIVIGSHAHGHGSNTATIGNSSIVSTYLSGNVSTVGTFNGFTLIPDNPGFEITAGITPKTLYIKNTLTLSGVDLSTLNIGSGGVLGSAAYTSSSDYLLANGASSGATSLIQKFISGVRTKLICPITDSVASIIISKSDGVTPIINIDSTTATTNFLGNINVNGCTIGIGGSSIPQNIAIGINSLLGNTTGNYNTAIGSYSLGNNITGSNNISIGVNSGRVYFGSSSLTNPSSSIFIGNNTQPFSDNESNEIVIGNGTLGAGSNSTMIGNGYTTKTFLKGYLSVNGAPISSNLTLQGSTSSAGTSSMKIIPGTVMATPESGAIESDGTHLYWTNSSGVRKQLDN